MIWNQPNPAANATFEATKRAAESAGLEVTPVSIGSVEDLERAIDQAARNRPDALVIVHDILTVNNRGIIASTALKLGLPSICATSPYVDVGGLIAYAPNLQSIFKRSATFVDRIIRGEKPGDIPIEQPTKFELRVNLRTAKALGITIPLMLLAGADDVIE